MHWDEFKPWLRDQGIDPHHVKSIQVDTSRPGYEMVMTITTYATNSDGHRFTVRDPDTNETIVATETKSVPLPWCFTAKAHEASSMAEEFKSFVL